MASSVSSVNSNTANSIYGNRNVISGLASGMDTESMIENAVSGIKTRISNLGQKRTKWEWKQEAYRSIIDKMVKFNQKYTSYTSSSNLFSAGFFNNAVTNSANGANAAKVSATGKTSSNISLTDVTQLASNGRYAVGSDALGIPTGTSTPPAATGSETLDLAKQIDVSTMSGSMTLTYGTKKVSIDFGEMENFDATKPEELAKAINKKLEGQRITTSSGEAVKASERIKAEVKDGKIVFSDKADAGNNVYISAATGDLKDTLGLTSLGGKDVNSIDLTGKALTEEKATGEYLAGKTLSVTLDGKTKQITMPAYDPATGADGFRDGLNRELTSAFGAGKVTASMTSDGKLQFTGQRGSTIGVTSGVGKALGLGENGSFSYMDMGKTLGELSKDGGNKLFDGLTEVELAIEGAVTSKDGKLHDEAGNAIGGDSLTGYYRIGKDGQKLVGYEMKINDKTIGTYTRDTAMDKVISDINNNTEAGVGITYSKTTSQFVFTAKDTGSASGVKIDGGLAANMFGTADERGKDAIFSMEVNGVKYNNMTRSGNSFDVDGLKLTLNGEFAASTEAVTFTAKTDTEKIMTAIKDLAKDYNEMMAEIKTAYGTMPAQKANKAKYEPLTDEDKVGMSESAIEAYEKKAKEGILFADNDLSNLYNKMRSVFTSGSVDGGFMRNSGIDVTYSATEGTVVKIDEDKLRAALENNLDGVKELFTKTKEGGAETNGIMANLKAQLDNYAGTNGEPKGLLIQRAGTPLSPTSILKNTMQTAMNNIDQEIERWETKLSDQVDRYTRQFSQLEQLVAQMNSQSSSLMGMMGGTG